MRRFPIALLGVAALAGCAAPPLGPLVQVLPGPNKPYNQFLAEDSQCRAQAQYQVAGQAQYANNRAVGGAVLTTVLGTGLGAIVGGGRGAAVGAVTGAGLGAGLGAGTSAGAQSGIQAQYDAVYAQCMYANGNQVPGIAPVVAYQPVPYPEPVPYAQPVPYPQPVYGSSGPYATSQPTPLVRDIQLQLQRRSYYVGPVNGVDGPATAAAIQQFQAAQRLPVDGLATPYLLEALRTAPVGY